MGKHFRDAQVSSAACGQMQGLQFVVLDIYSESGGVFHVWGTTPEGESVLVRVQDFSPHFCISAPTPEV